MTYSMPAISNLRSLAVLAAIFTLALIAALSAPQSAEARACGTTHVDNYDIGWSYAIRVRAKRTSCRGARRLGRHFYGDIGTHHHGGPSNAESWWTLDHFPGWKCGTGAGGGGCKKRGGRRVIFETFATEF